VRVGEAERHDEELEQALVCAERGLVDVVRVHQDLMIAGAHVQLGEEPRPAQLVQQLLHHRDGKLVLDGGVVEREVIHAETP